MRFYDYLAKIEEKIPFPYVSGKYKNRHYAPEMREQILSVKEIIKEGRALIKDHYNSDVRTRTASVRILEMHADYCDMLVDAFAEKCVGNDEAAMDCYEKFRIEIGRRESEFALVYDQFLMMSSLGNVIFAKSTEESLLLS